MADDQNARKAQNLATYKLEGNTLQIPAGCWLAHEQFQLVLSLLAPYEFNYQRSNIIVSPSHLAVIQSFFLVQ